jgi:hexokinase
MSSISSLLAGLVPPGTEQMRIISASLVASIKAHLQDPIGATMLPSYMHTLPGGNETGKTLAVDLGGSTLRVAVIQLSGGKEVLERKSWVVTDVVKQLPGTQFFDWVAERIAGVVTEELGQVVGVGLTWSFPIM